MTWHAIVTAALHYWWAVPVGVVSAIVLVPRDDDTGRRPR